MIDVFYGTQIGIFTLMKSGSGSNGNEGVLRFFKAQVLEPHYHMQYNVRPRNFVGNGELSPSAENVTKCRNFYSKEISFCLCNHDLLFETVLIFIHTHLEFFPDIYVKLLYTTPPSERYLDIDLKLYRGVWIR